MANINVDNEEARLISIRRAIKKLDKDALIDISDASAAAGILDVVEDVEQLEKDLSGAELVTFIRGYVAGLAASNVGEVVPYGEYFDEPVQATAEALNQPEHNATEPQQFVGGPTGGVELRQGEDKDFVTQSGVHDGQNDG